MMNYVHSHPQAGPARNGARCAVAGAVWYAVIGAPLDAAGAFEGAVFVGSTPQHTSVEDREILPDAGVTTAPSIACM